jgi:NAD(P)-dependent dehydrogenase (short-subunit alcohol dehydrogenase family)
MAEDRRVALITGGTRGIGLGIARALAVEGWTLALCGVRPLDQVRETIESFAGKAEYIQCDVSSRSDRDRMVDAINARWGSIDALVNNAGRAPRVRADILEAEEENFEWLLRTNLQGPYFLTQSIVRQMLASESRVMRSIVFVTSVSAQMVSTQRGDYCVSKAGLAMTAQLFAARLASTGIQVYEVRPGVIATDMTAPVREMYDQRIASGLIPEGRWGQPEDLGRVVAALVRGDAPYATGSVIHVDGGLTIPRL